MLDSPTVFWQSCLEKFSQEFDAVTYNAFIKPLDIHLESDTFYIIASNSLTERWLKNNLHRSFEHFFAQANAPAKKFAFKTVSRPMSQEPQKQTHHPSTPTPISHSQPTGLIKDFTFASFIDGKANELALMAAKKIASGNSDNISPLFIYGGAGLGKTHLVQAVGNEYLKQHPHRKVRFTTARNFLQTFVTACRTNQVERFKDNYQNLDMLIVDDIQNIGGDKERTQEEFFYLFNILQDSNREIIITCDKAPSEIKDMTTRLTSRFNSGVALHIPPPEFELRAGIVRFRSAQWKQTFSEEVISFVAENVRSNVRELQGAVKRIIALCEYKGTAPTLPLCKEALADLLGKNNAVILPDTIKEKVAHYYGVRINDLSAKKRHQSVALPRHVAVYLCRQLTNLSLPEIGKHFNRNHTTVLYSCRLIEDMVKKDKNFLDQVHHLEMRIKETP